MVMRKDNTLQMSRLMYNASYIPLYTQRNLAAHANDNYEYITYTDIYYAIISLCNCYRLRSCNACQDDVRTSR